MPCDFFRNRVVSHEIHPEGESIGNYVARYLALSSVCHFRGSPFELSIHLGSVFCPVIKGFECTPLTFNLRSYK